jgi:TetR/AcrR family transcriptional regulator, cholesterol catabolism regulator
LTPDKRTRKRLDKRERIRTAALELFSRDGFEGTTTKAVAKRAGIAAGTLFLYADDKTDLLFLVMHERLQRATDERFGSLPTVALRDQLLYVFRGLFEMYAEHPSVAAAFVRAFPGAQGRNARALEALTFSFLHRISELIRDAQERGDVDAGVSPVLAAQNIFMLYFGALLAWINRMATLEAALDPLLASALELQFRGLLPRD